MNDSDENVISNNTLLNNNEGIFLVYSFSNRVYDNLAVSNQEGIYLYDSSYNTINSNTLKKNAEAVQLYNSYDNAFKRNSLTSNINFGFMIESSDQNTFIDNTLTDNDYSIYLKESHSNTIKYNEISASRAYGILIADSDSTNVSFNNISGSSYDGIHIGGSNFNRIYDNNISLCNDHGVALWMSNSNVLDNNILTGNGIGIFGGAIQHWTTNTIGLTNTVNGKPVYYIKNREGGTIPAEAGQIILANCDGVTIRDQKLSNVTSGFILAFSANNFITNITSKDNSQYGLYLYNSQNNYINNSEFSNNTAGIELIETSNDNAIIENSIMNNDLGISIQTSWQNHVNKNLFIDNDNQVNCGTNVNYWNEDYPSFGNYWSNYHGPDNNNGPYQSRPGADGIGDEPFFINDGNKDEYPLMKTPGEKPGAPQNCIAEAGKSFVKLTWEHPDSDGGFPVINYKIIRSKPGGPYFLLKDDVTKLYLNDTEVKNGETYFYKISAGNVMGESEYSEVVTAEPGGIPGKPWDLNTQAGDDFIKITWRAPLDSGGLPITNYMIYKGLAEGLETFYIETGSQLSFKDYKINAAVTYFYRVSAKNNFGEGPLSEGKRAIIYTVPSAPRDLQAEAGDSVVHLTWSTPLSDGGMSVKYYNIFRNTEQGNPKRLIVIDNKLSYSDTDVENGVTYYYQISAESEFDEGPLSAEVSATPEAEYDRNQPPKASIAVNTTSGAPPLSVSFTGIGTDSDGFIVYYKWDFGDGNLTYEQNPNHTYKNIGTYYVVLTVIDNQEAASTAMITITVKPEIPQNPTDGDGVDSTDTKAADDINAQIARIILASGAAIIIGIGLILILWQLLLIKRKTTEKKVPSRETEVTRKKMRIKESGQIPEESSQITSEEEFEEE
jgi:parallel beta-helix repeat protein